jgi:hypothetical protein
MSSDERAKTGEKETIARKRLRDGISPSDEKVKTRTPEMLIESKERARLRKMTSRLGISPDEKAKMREKAKNTMKRLRDSTETLIESKERARLQKMKSKLGMSHDEKAKMRKKTKNTMNRLRDSISPDEKTKIREKAKNTMNRLRNSMSPDEKAKMKEREKMEGRY